MHDIILKPTDGARRKLDRSRETAQFDFAIEGCTRQATERQYFAYSHQAVSSRYLMIGVHFCFLSYRMLCLIKYVLTSCVCLVQATRRRDAPHGHGHGA